MDKVLAFLKNVVLSDSFSRAVDISSLGINILLFLIALLTFFYTFLYNGISLISLISHHSMFYGNHFGITLKNKSFHSISISEVFIIFKQKGNYYRLLLFSEKTPVIIEPFSISYVQSDDFTLIHGVDWYHNNWSEASVIGVKYGDKVIWVKSSKNGLSKRIAKQVYEGTRRTPYTLYKYIIEDVVISEKVKYYIRIRNENEEDNVKYDNYLAIISGTDNCLVLNKGIGLDKEFPLKQDKDYSADEISSVISEKTGIDVSRIIVHEIKGIENE